MANRIDAPGRGLVASLLLAAAVAFIPALAAAAPVSQEQQAPPAAPPLASAGPANALGYEIDLDDLPAPHPRPAGAAVGAANGPLWLRVGIPWATVEKTPGQYDWAVTDEIILSHAEAGYRVILRPHGDNPLHPSLKSEDRASLDAWSAFLRALALRYKDQADHYVLGGRLGEIPPRDAAYLLKLSSVVILGADPGSRIVLGDLDASEPAAAATLEALYAEEVAAYVDAVAVSGEGEMTAIRAQMMLHDPGAALWRTRRPIAGGVAAGGALLRAYLEGLEQEVALSLFKVGFGPDGLPPLLPVIQRIRDGFSPSLTPLVESARGIQVMTPMGQPLDVRTLRLFDPDARKVLIAYDAGPGAARGAQAVMAIDTLDIADPVLEDIAAGESASAGGFQKDEAAGLTRVALPLADYPLVLEYRRFTSPLYGEGEKLEVTGVRTPSVEEILANHQAFQAAQDASLVNMRAEARVDYHFRVGTGSTYDVTVLCSFYLDPNVGAEFEQKEFYVGGVKWRSDRIPEFPIPQPEKVMTLPLDITLDRRYEYRLAGEDTVEGRDCWTIEFLPREPGGSLYKGRVWIDKKSYAKVRISSLQTGLEAPIISNDEKDTYRPVRGPEGIEYWLLSRIEGQQVFSTSGRNLVMVREVTLSDPVVNDPGFDEIRRQAYASPHQILRDTPHGQRYLERTPDGGRTVKEKLDHDNLSLLGGVLYNRSLDFPLPLAGFNYFNSDLAGRGIQTNVLFGGILLIATAGKPKVWGTPLELNLDLYAQGFSSTDKPVREGKEIDKQNVDLASQAFSLGIGLPFADYWKVKLTGDMEYQTYSRDKETAGRFLIPTDTFVRTVGLDGEFNRSTWSVVGSIAASRRSRWEPWGFSDPNRPTWPTIGQEDVNDERDYVRYQGVVSKDFFLPLNQKVHAALRAYGGSDLDRFSQYRFTAFDNHVQGFSGSGIRYTSGLKADLQYAFNLGDLIRFGATVAHARVNDRLTAGGDVGRFTGVGLSGQTILGPNLLVSVEWGVAVGSSVPEFRGDQEIFLTLLRLFH
ncbi:MAG TPA: hypothetical protein VGK94_15845 [Candidatus Polarisedimenticolia bacterium]